MSQLYRLRYLAGWVENMNGRFYKGHQYHGKNRATYFKQWSCEFVQCIKCGTKNKKGKHKHKARGLCVSCWDKERAKNPQRKKQLKNQGQKWYSKVRGTEAYRIYCNDHQKNWYKNINPYAWRASYRRAQLKLRFKKFILGKARIDKRNNNGLKFYCNGCSKRCLYQSCVKPPQTVKSEKDRTVRDLEIFKKVLLKNCPKKL